MVNNINMKIKHTKWYFPLIHGFPVSYFQFPLIYSYKIWAGADLDIFPLHAIGVDNVDKQSSVKSVEILTYIGPYLLLMALTCHFIFLDFILNIGMVLYDGFTFLPWPYYVAFIFGLLLAISFGLQFGQRHCLIWWFCFFSLSFVLCSLHIWAFTCNFIWPLIWP